MPGRAPCRRVFVRPGGRKEGARGEVSDGAGAPYGDLAVGGRWSAVSAHVAEPGRGSEVFGGVARAFVGRAAHLGHVTGEGRMEAHLGDVVDAGPVQPAAEERRLEVAAE